MDKWTRVDKELPVAYRSVLVCTRTLTKLYPGYTYIGAYAAAHQEKTGEVCFIREFDNHLDDEATHWMYLPAFPEDMELQEPKEIK